MSKLGIDKYKDEFHKIRVRHNLENCVHVGILLLILEVILMVVDLTVYIPFWSGNPSYVYLFYSHIIITAVLIIWLALSKSIINQGSILIGKIAYYSLITIVLYWGVFLGLNDLFISGQVSSYIIGVFGIAAIIYIGPVTALFTFSMVTLIFIAGLIYFEKNTGILLSHIINISVVGIISYTVSRIRLTSLLSDFLTNKELLISKTRTEEAYRKLEESNKKLKSEIKERLIAEEKIAHLIYYDALTGIYNRKKVMEDVQLFLDTDEKFAILFIDLDKFKEINDKYGHEAGDCVLKVAAARLQSIICPSDTISRIGGDEFIIILRSWDDAAYTQELAATIIKELSMVITINGNQFNIGASIGISLFPSHGADADTLISKADMAMYQVKKRGGCGFFIYNESKPHFVLQPN